VRKSILCVPSSLIAFESDTCKIEKLLGVSGPNRTLPVPYHGAMQLSHCGHSCILQHFFG